MATHCRWRLTRTKNAYVRRRKHWTPHSRDWVLHRTYFLTKSENRFVASTTFNFMDKVTMRMWLHITDQGHSPKPTQLLLMYFFFFFVLIVDDCKIFVVNRRVCRNVWECNFIVLFGWSTRNCFSRCERTDTWMENFRSLALLFVRGKRFSWLQEFARGTRA